jgi:hypothetical protein
MTIQEAILLAGIVALLWSVAMAWIFLRSVERRFKQITVQQRLLEHSQRVSGLKSWNEAEIAEAAAPWAKGAEQNARRGSDVLHIAAASRALRYTDEHRREAKRRRAREAEVAKIEAAEPKHGQEPWKRPPDSSLEPYTTKGGIAAGGE